MENNLVADLVAESTRKLALIAEESRTRSFLTIAMMMDEAANKKQTLETLQLEIHRQASVIRKHAL